MTPSFVHLRVHSDYSLVDSTIRLPDKPEYGDPAKAARANLISRAAQLEMPALALTDQSNLFALVKFYRAAEANGIKPIAGADLWIANPADPGRPSRLTLLCQNRRGYLNLVQLISRSYIEGRRGDHALVDFDWFAGRSDGLIALSGREGDIAQLALADKHEAARARTHEWLRLFGDRWYFELTRCGHAGEEHWIDAALHLAAKADCAAVATNDVRFLTRADFEAHEARVCIHQGRLLNDPKRPRDYTPQQYLKSADEMAQAFADLPAALQNSVEIAKRCNLELTFGTYHLPDFPVPEGQTLESHIGAVAGRGLRAHLEKSGMAPGFTREDYERRLQNELAVIGKMGFSGYFLIVADFINWAKRNDIPVGPGRGSGAGSVVAWSLGITDLDPLRYGLLFERFLNPERVSMPDFDVDFCMDRRDEVIAYVADKYGHDRVSQIITYGTMAAKAVLRDSGRAQGLPYGFVDRIAKLIPMRPLDLTLQDALGRTKKSEEEPERVVAEFKSLYEIDEDVRGLVDLAIELEDLTRNAGKHAGGVVIAPSPLTDFAPLYSDGGGDGVVTQFDKDDVEAVGLVKFDFLGLRTLTIIDWAVKAINARRARNGEDAIAIDRLPLDDADVYGLLRKAQTVAVFQLEGRGMQGMLKDAKPDSFEDIIALVSLYRPGPMELIPSYCRRKQGTESIEYPDPRVEPVLKETYGIMVYQEQVMQMAQIVGGYTLGGADLLRRAMGKKNVAEMAKQRAVFRDGAANNGLAAAQADAIFDLMEKFAGYGFNKSHAAAYALVAYQTAWLKVHYPAEFMAAVLSSDMDNTDKVVTFLAEARALGLTVLPPDVNASAYMFEALDPEPSSPRRRSQSIRYGLGAVKGVGRGAVESIVEARRGGGAFRDLADFCARVDAQKLNKRALEALIMSGSTDALAKNRASLMAQLPAATRAAEQAARDAQSGQNDMFGAAGPVARKVELPEVADWPIEQSLAGERETLGHYLSGHPTDAWRDLIAKVATCAIGDIDKHFKPPPPDRQFRYADQQNFTLVGAFMGLRKQGDARAFVQVEDFSGRFEAILYREAWVEFGPLLTRDAILVFEGGLSIDEFAGGYRMRAQRIVDVKTVCERQARLLRVRLNGIDGGFARRLQDVLAGFRGGTTPVRLTVRNPAAQGEIELGPEWRVRASPELRQTLERLKGVTAADFVFGRGEG